MLGKLLQGRYQLFKSKCRRGCVKPTLLEDTAGDYYRICVIKHLKPPAATLTHWKLSDNYSPEKHKP